MALHKMLRLITMAIGGEGYLNFMGNEFGHPEWVDFPREGNEWSHDHCRRRWDLADTEYLRHFELNNFDKQMMNLDKRYDFLAHEHQWVSTACEERKLIVAERGPLYLRLQLPPHQHVRRPGNRRRHAGQVPHHPRHGRVGFRRQGPRQPRRRALHQPGRPRVLGRTLRAGGRRAA